MRPLRHAPVPLLLCLLFPAVSFAQPRAGDDSASTCPAERRVRFDPVTWTKQLRAADETQKVQSLLKAARLAPIDESCSEPQGNRPWFSAVNAFVAPIDAGGRQVRVVNVVGGVCADAPAPATAGAPEFQRGAVYVAISDGAWCQLDAPFLNAQGSPYGASLCVPTVFGFESLVSVDRKALRVTEKQEWCGGAGSARGGAERLGYYEVRGWALHSLFRLQTYEGAYDSATAWGWETNRRIQLKGGVPKVIEVSTNTTCLQSADDPPPNAYVAEAYACTPVKARSVWRYREGIYGEEKRSP